MSNEAWLAAHARERPGADALECGAQVVSYAELHRRAAAAAGSLAARGVGPGDRVALALAPGIDFAVALHACLLMGAAALPLDLREPQSSRDERGRTARVVVDAPLAETDPVVARGWEKQDVAVVVHTSGTTGAPKEVAITYGNVVANAEGSAAALGLDRAEHWLCPLPLVHVGGLMVLLRSLFYGTAALLQPPPFDAAATAAALARDDVTLASLVPTMLARVLDAGLRAPPRLRCVLLGGGPVDPALVDRARAAGVPVAQTYGMTEATSQITVSDIGDAATAGRPLPGVEVTLGDDGEILVDGPVVAGGGVLHTGDRGAFDDEGRLTVTGRIADTIVTGGENVAPTEVEGVLLAHPAVAEAAVFGRPDERWGEVLCARVVLTSGLECDPGDLREFCRPRLAAFKVPKRIEIAASLPRTASGKLLRRQLS